MRHARTLASLIAAFAAIGACTSAEPVTQGDGGRDYLGIETLLLDGDLVNFRVAMKGGNGPVDIEDYGRCAAAQYALIRGAGFARHVRTSVDLAGGVWRGDAVYTISAALPLGVRNIDAEVTVRDCAARGIPTI
ncbi:MAG: hypothetical protein MUD11_15275 [Rhodobacteraceae bacterium]|jgi:hypothetical protein|nr:hypothetical protein [Paracoccaceae bacterium]